jgi:hypothetical protein
VLAAMQAMLQVSDFTSSAACAPVKAFQSAWNSAGGTPTLTVDGGYGPNTASAAGQVAAANGGGNVPSALTSGYPNCGGTPTPPSPPAPIVPASSGLSTWAKVLIGVLIVGGIAGLGYMLFIRPKKGTRSYASEPTKRKGKRGKRPRKARKK